MGLENFNKTEVPSEKVKEAAIMFGGVVYTGPMHLHAYQKAKADVPLMLQKFPDTIEEGFVTTTGRFITREEAGRMAEEVGQLDHIEDEYRVSAARSLDSHDLPDNKKLVDDWV